MRKASLLAALIAAMVFGLAEGASPQAADSQYCTPAEAQYGECDEDVTIIVNPPPVPGQPPVSPPGDTGDPGGAEILPDLDDVIGDELDDVASETGAAGSAPAESALAEAISPEPSGAATVPETEGQAGGVTAGNVPEATGSEVGVLPDTGGLKPPAAFGAILVVLIGAILLLRSRSRI